MPQTIRPERTIERFSRGGELRLAIHRLWAENRRLAPGSNRRIAERIEALCAAFDLTPAEWHYWARAVALRNADEPLEV